MKKTSCYLSLMIGAGCLYFSIFPYLMHGVWNIGSIVLLFTAIFFAMLPKYFFPLLRKYRILKIAVATAFGCFFILSGLMLWVAHGNTATVENSGVVLVLGARTNNGEPSTILKKRLDKAVDFYHAGFKGKFIVCGKTPESDTMKAYLVKHGLPEQNIILENQSTTTAENIFFASKIIDQMQLPKNIAIASDSFHQMRSHLYAKECGLTPKSISSATPPILLPSYWIRDMGGVVLAMLNV